MTFSILKTIRQKILEKLPKLPLGTVMDMQSGKMKQIIVDQVDGMETTLAHLFPKLTANIGGPILIIIYLFILDWRMALLSLVTIPVGMACTTVLGNIETLVPMVLVDIMGGVVGTVVFTAMIIIFEWRVGLVALAGIILYFLVVSAMEKKSAAIAPNAQKSQTALTSAVLEYVQGMGVVKSFNLSGRGIKL